VVVVSCIVSLQQPMFEHHRRRWRRRRRISCSHAAEDTIIDKIKQASNFYRNRSVLLAR